MKSSLKNRRDCIIRSFEEIESVRSICGLIFPLTTGKDCRGVSIALLKADKPAKPHFHNFTTEIYFILEGKGYVRVDDKQERIKKGNVVVIYPKTIHNLIPLNSVLEVLVVAAPAWTEEDEFEV